MPPRKRRASSGRSRASANTDPPADSTGRSGGQGTGTFGDVRSLVLDTSTPGATRVLHEAYLQYRVEGREPPSAQLYLQAVEGSVSFPVPSVRGRP